ncbi:hypothetical protein D3C80_1557280 [compost metagenome]
MTAQIAIGMVGPDHHRQGVPAQDTGDALVQLKVTGINALLLHRQGVAIGGKSLGIALQAQLQGMGL